ncbi:MAG TPA: rhodanese-like domain-containing protein [Steroidobacteraceae bacterium]|nr:rhodanese-like domain-containing protein [Steroidobacteraceae bacterium]HRX90260.1 rhodanese-like domain-containing protein [Steroidobacteraceae bacterium]
MVAEVTVQELKQRRDAQSTPLVIDVREAWELEIAALPGVVHMPMNDVPQRLSELDRNAETWVLCRSGGRSMKVAQYLESQGFQQVANLAGGILAWSAEIDPNVKQY